MVALLTGMLYAPSAQALRVNFQRLGDSDRLIFAFDSGSLPNYSVRRVGTEEVAVTFEPGIWDTETRPGTKDFPGKLVKAIRATDNGVQITTSTNGFGFIKLPTPGKPEFVLQIFRDPIGARWKPPAAADQQAQQAQDQPQETPQASPDPPAQPSTAQPEEQPASQPVAQPQAVSQPSPQPVQQVQQAQPAPVEGEADLPPEQATGERKPFFSVPYSVRTEVSPPGEAQPAPTAPAPEASTGRYPASSELRFKAVNKSAEEVKFAELAGPAASAPIAAPPSVSDSGAGQVGGSVSAPVTAPSSQQSQPVAQPVTPPDQEEDSAVQGAANQPTEPVSGQGQAGGSVAPPPAASPAAQAVPMSGQGQVGGSVAPPPTVVQGAPPPEPTPEEVAQVAQPVAPPPEPVQQPEPQPEAVVEDAPAEVADTEQTPDSQEEVATAEGAEGGEGAEAEVDPVEELNNLIYEAQSMMFNGNLEEAKRLYGEILKKPNVPLDVREEALYAIADVTKQLNGDDLAGHFDEISQAYIEAMNANLRSTKVPRALLNLGLVNLQVGNFPEAKAYFKILQERYPDDDNIPSVSYYWGEYYYKMGDYKKAADQFQYLIQTYPEHQLVKQAAYYLADSLNRTGFLDQAFQIVDYIDKRWPDYYMENPTFLRLAGGVEMQLKRWPQAKNHYFTYYNLNPEAEAADIVLARIGDIYVRENEKEAARQIYEKVVQNYPDKEGGLVAKMRLAEEGIYDDPSMPGMVTVFDRPYNKRPENVYKEIVRDYPDSPLAPIAQLKLGMWYAFNKQYSDALAAAQDLIEKYPDSPLVERARKLGDSVFVLAVPGMVAEERYGRVVRYWETYDFIGTKDTKVNDNTKLNVALSFWKVGQAAKAMELLEPYLQERPVKGISEEALGIAINLYLDQLAWKEIADLVAMAKTNWNLSTEQLRQLDYARAMALQNMGEENKAIALWAELAADANVDPSFRAYAMYYMAKDAMDRQDLRRVFVYSQEALSMLLQTGGDAEKIKDAVLMSIYATERSGRYNEALKWAKEFDRYIDVDNPEWASTRFKLARIYRKAGAIEEWKQLLGDIIEKKPETLQAQLAKSALETYQLEQEAQQYSPGPQ